MLRGEPAPTICSLSYGERALWLLHELAPESPAYNIALALQLNAPIDLGALSCAIQSLVDRHDVLRSTYALDGVTPVRRIHSWASLPLEHVDARGWPAEREREEVAARLAEPFDLTTGPLVRLTLLTRGPEEHVLLLASHHIVLDSWSTVAVLIPEFRAAYAAIVQGDARAVDREAPVKYAEFVAWQADLLAADEGATQRAYWHAQLNGDLPVLRLRSDRPRPARKRFVGATEHFTLESDLARRLKLLARKQRTTLATVLLSAYAVLLQRYSSQDELLIGMPMAGRTERRFNRTAGYFVNPLPLRARIEDNDSLPSLLGSMHHGMRGVLDHQDYPFARLVEELQPRRDVSRSPLFDVMFNFVDLRRSTSSRASAGQGLPITVRSVPSQEGQFDLVLELADTTDGLQAELRYSTDLFDRETVERMGALYRAVLSAMADNPDASVGDLPGLAVAERDRLRLWSDPSVGTTQLAATMTNAPAEEVLRDIFAEVLGLSDVAPTDDFFALGGHSLQAMQVIARIAAAFEVDVPLQTFFEGPTVRGLAAWLEGRTGSPATPPLVEVGPEHGPVELSFAQQRLWFIHSTNPDSSAYNVAWAARLRGTLDREALERAANLLAERHASLRTSIRTTDAGPVQVVAHDVSVNLPLIDLSGMEPDVAEDEVRARASDFAAMPFDVAEPPLMRLALFRLATDVHVLTVVLHHLVSDAWSISIYAREVAAMYQALVERRTPNLPALPMQFADVGRWQRQSFRGDVLENQLAYWRERLQGLQPLQLPTDRPRPAVYTHHGAHRVYDFPPDLLDALRMWSRRESATPFMAFLTGFIGLLSRYSGQTDIAVGVPIANRRWLQTENVIGPLVNTLVVRTDVSAEPTGSDLLRQVRTRALEAYSHQDIPFDLVVANLQPERAASRSPLFQVMFDYVNTPLGDIQLPDLTWTAEHVDRRGAQFDLTLMVIDTPSVHRISLEYNTDLFDDSTIDRFVEHLQTLLAAMLADPDARVARLPMLPQSERRQLLTEWNATDADFPREACIQDLVAAQSSRTPAAIAVAACDDTLTYAELEQRSNRLARYLRSRGIGPGQLVAIHLERTALVPVALLGVLKSGAAYLPIDPAYPAERRDFVIQDSGVRVALTQQSLAHDLASSGVQLIRMDDVDEVAAIRACEDAFLTPDISPDDVAYVIYTSGSTGQPKGVQVGHRSVVNFLSSMRSEPGLDAHDTLVAITSLSFDISVLELFLPLSVGGRLVIAQRETTVDGAQLKRLLTSSRATAMQATPVTWRLLVDADWQPSGRFTAICGGEALPTDLAADLLARGVDLWNAYGPTETTVWSTLHRVRCASARIPIGKPIANTRVYVLDSRLQLVPPGVNGELYIGGAGLAHGYLRRPQLTEDRFVADPFRPGERLYRTGDIARWLTDGTLDVLGRQDQQVKIRGHRVELGEIEASLRQHSAVHDACVALRPSGSVDAQLVAYVTSPSENIDSRSMRAFLRERLPEFMVPSAIVHLSRLPRTPNGKLDRAALPSPVEPALADAYAPPRNDIERALVGEWEDLLGQSPIGIHDNFFDVGGHSLLAIRLVYRLQERFGWQVPLAMFLRSTTIAELAALVRQPERPAGWRSLVELQTSTGSATVFLVHGLLGDLLSFSELVQALGPEYTVYGLRAIGLEGFETPQLSVEEMASAYIQEMRAVQPHGPYRLLGWSAGGSIAYEIARQLDALGERVDMLAILDHPPAGGAAVQSASASTRLRRLSAHVVENMPWWWDVLRSADLSENWRMLSGRLRFMRPQIGGPVESIAREIEATQGLEYIREWPEFRRRLLHAQIEAMTRYRPLPYAGRLLLFRCTRQPLLSEHDPLLGWGPYARGGVEVIRVRGRHSGLLRGANAQLVANTMAARLRPRA